jgi:ADP-ribose pyrophosphatase
MGDFKIVKKETMYTGKAFNVVKLYYRLPNGKEKPYDLVDHVDAVTIVAVDTNSEILFVTQYRIGGQKKLLELPAGVIDENEHPSITAKRELREEVGMDANFLEEIGGFYMVPGYSNEYMHVFLAKELKFAPLQADDDEFLDIVRIPILQAYKMAEQGLIHDGKSLAALFLAYNYLHNY